MTRKWLTELHYGGVRVGRVFWFDRRRGAGVYLMYSHGGTFAFVPVAKLSGRRDNRWSLTEAEVRAELEARAGITFGAARGNTEVTGDAGAEAA